MADQGYMAEELSVNAKENAFDRRLLPHMQSDRFLQYLFLGFSIPLLLQYMFRPRRHHHLDPVNIRSSEVLVKAPAESPISKMDQTDLAQKANELGTTMAIDLKFISDRDRSIVWPWDM